MKNVQRGVDLIAELAGPLPDTPGVYRMLGEDGAVLYVGKAKALKKRVVSYTHAARLSVRIKRMVALTHDMEFVHTHTETDALLLEANLIKKLKPKFNILLRDDKSFPYIFITGMHDFPLLTKHRGSRKKKGYYFGPFASARDVNQTLDMLQRAFLLRNCSDTVFAARTRPCLQYHIKRCTAPCVDLVSKGDYAKQVAQAQDFLSGKSRAVQDAMQAEMQAASAAQDYEAAALYRDRIKVLTAVQSKNDISIPGMVDTDVIGLIQKQGVSCVQVFFFRNGQNYGNKAYFPRHHREDEPGDILAAFLAQFYQSRPVPKVILVNQDVTDQGVLTEALSLKSEHQVTIKKPVRGRLKAVIRFAENNAAQALLRRLQVSAAEKKVLQGVADLFDLKAPPARIEVYDNSHISGTHMVGAMIVSGSAGLRKNAYRTFNIKKAAASDDYAMMREVITRRFRRALSEPDTGDGGSWPDLIIIDGGRGQLTAVCSVLETLGISDRVNVVAIAKGPDRQAGREEFHMPDKLAFSCAPDDPVLHYLQRLRDEAHRFAVGAHRSRRGSGMIASALDEIPGVGSKRKKALLLHFGSVKAISAAGVKDIQSVTGISEAMAQSIYDHFH